MLEQSSSKTIQGTIPAYYIFSVSRGFTITGINRLVVGRVARFQSNVGVVKRDLNLFRHCSDFDLSIVLQPA